MSHAIVHSYTADGQQVDVCFVYADSRNAFDGVALLHLMDLYRVLVLINERGEFTVLKDNLGESVTVRP